MKAISVWADAFSIIAAVLWFLMFPSACPRIKWGSWEKHEVSGGRYIWAKQKLWKKQLSVIVKGKTQQLNWKNAAWKTLNNFSRKSSAFFLFTGNCKLFDLKMVCTVTIWEFYKRCLEMVMWKKVKKFEREVLFQEKCQYERRCQNTSGKKRGWCCSQNVLDWSEKQVKKSLDFSVIL